MATPKKETKVVSPLAVYINEKMAAQVLTGKVWDSEETAVHFLETFLSIRESFEKIRKSYDEQLKKRRNDDPGFMPKVEHIRKPREDAKAEDNNAELLAMFEV